MKTPKEFDYDLWKDETGRGFIRVKRTGEVCEVNDDTFRVLRNEAMAIYRNNKGVPVYGVENGKSVVVRYTTNLALYIEEGNEDIGADWNIDKTDLENEILTKLLIEDFCELLTDKQLDVLEQCLKKGMLPAEYAKEKGISKRAVGYTIEGIEKKAKKFFD
ncbi:hypothetical protein [Tannockella kyphosi]|uniref:hypothetical protein n=1 Tax=Tannockella kyphosi TaxID=2899121 RepID=UPI002010C937|nr:hypothetical protein [Tannockella kyphosi]